MRTTFILPSILAFAAPTLCDVGLALIYNPPFDGYTKCQNVDFPGNRIWVAAGDGVWDNGGSCRRLYQIRCISGAGRGGACAGSTKPGAEDPVVTARIVQYKPGPYTIYLSPAANKVLNKGKGPIRVEFAEI